MVVKYNSSQGLIKINNADALIYSEHSNTMAIVYNNHTELVRIESKDLISCKTRNSSDE